jgi:hypothetical protein
VHLFANLDSLVHQFIEGQDCIEFTQGGNLASGTPLLWDEQRALLCL